MKLNTKIETYEQEIEKSNRPAAVEVAATEFKETEIPQPNGLKKEPETIPEEPQGAPEEEKDHE